MAQRKHLDDFYVVEYLDDWNVDVPAGSHPQITTPNEDRYLAVTAKRNRRSTASDMSRQLSSATGTTVSRQTVYRRSGHIGLYARRLLDVFHIPQLTVACY
ncbi:transposable element Tcb1 transposase [Trichonephila clavipes]|nr:transposable element Tcb1 transposase [Trichonephila clavipes]